MEELYAKIIEGCTRGKSYIIDDGSYAHAVVSREGKAMLVDPHVNEEVGKMLEAVELLEKFITTKRGWMVLEVCQND